MRSPVNTRSWCSAVGHDAAPVIALLVDDDGAVDEPQPAVRSSVMAAIDPTRIAVTPQP